MTAKWAAYRVVSYRIVSYQIGLESRDIDTVYTYLLLLDKRTRVSASLFARYLRYLHNYNYRSASVSRYARRIQIELTSLPSPHNDNSFSSLYLHCTILCSDVQLLGIGHVDKLYWSSHSASFRLRTSIFIVYSTIYMLYNYTSCRCPCCWCCWCCCCVLSALIGWRFIAQAVCEPRQSYLSVFQTLPNVYKVALISCQKRQQ